MKRAYLSALRSRRNFLRQTIGAALGTVAASNVFSNLRLMNAVLAQTGISDYKALVCIFLNGGNDSNNMIIPTVASEWQNYALLRGPLLAIPNTDTSSATALALDALNGDGSNGYPKSFGHTFGMHPAMPEMANLFNAGKAAVLFNAGTLSYPLTKTEYNGSVPKPPQLFFHTAQQEQWQTATADQPSTSGWGGRIADLFTTPVDVNAGGQISMAVTLAGSNIFEIGSANAAPQYSVTTGGVPAISGLTNARLAAFQSILNADKTSSDLLTKAYASALDRSISNASIITTALANNASASYLSRFPSSVTTPNGGPTLGSSLMSQMKMVARLIDAGKNQLGMKRQIFFIQATGYDTHTGQTSSAGNSNPSNATVILGQHANLLAELSQTMRALYLAMGDLGLANNVTAFTASEFSRTLPGNGSGSDHGWGGHHLIVGGAVKGQATYGTFPTLAINGPDDTSTGRWIPTTAVDQYAATLASWFGVDSSNLSTVFPNIGRFATPNLGFI